MQTFAAIVRALRAFYLLVVALGLLVFLVPSLYERVTADLGGKDTLLRVGIGVAFIGLLLEHARSSALGTRLSYVARRVLQLSPDLKRLEAVKILVRALDSDNEGVVDSAYTELKRLTGEDFGKESTAWRPWILKQERPPSASDKAKEKQVSS